jgi:5-hydroxyisourate hydrolase-like protein (transthyretin family)
LIADGKPAAGIEVNIVRGGTRHRNRLDNMSTKTGIDGKFTVTWPEAGMYWLEAELTDKNTSIPQAKQRRLSYAATLEVSPE